MSLYRQFSYFSQPVYQSSTYYQNYTTSIADKYIEAVCRVMGVDLTTATNSQTSYFTVKKWLSEDVRADWNNNPVGPFALSTAIGTPTAVVNTSNNKTMSSYINDFCSNNINGLGSTCIQWGTTQPTYAVAWVPSTCATFPNDDTLCGCENLQQYYGIINYIQVVSGARTAWLPYCGAANCANVKAWKLPTNVPDCTIQTCIQSVSAQATNVTIENLALTCAGESALASQDTTTLHWAPSFVFYLGLLALFAFLYIWYFGRRV